MLLLAERQCLQPLEKEERIERTERRPEIPKIEHPQSEGQGNVAQPGKILERVPENKAVVARVRLGIVREFAVPPVELAAVDNDAADGCAVSANEFGRRRSQDIGAVIKRTNKADANRVIHDQRNAGIMGDPGQSLEIRDIELRVFQWSLHRWPWSFPLWPF